MESKEEKRGGKKTFFPKGSGPRLAEDDVVFLHVCRWIECMFRSFSVRTGMAWDELAGSVRPDAPKRPAGSQLSLSWCLFSFCLATQAQRP